MSEQTDLILRAIDDVKGEMLRRFDLVDDAHRHATASLKEHDSRISAIEHTLLRYSTLGRAVGVLATFLGYDVLKHHFPWAK